MEIALVLGLLVIAIVLFSMERIGVDVVTGVLLVVLVITGILSPTEAFEAFGSEFIVMLASIYVITAAVETSGVLDELAARLSRSRPAKMVPLMIWLLLFMLAVPIGLFIAIFLNQTVTGIRIYKSLFFFPFVISQVVVGLLFSWFYAPNFGLLYKLIEWLTGTGIAFLADPDKVTYALVAAGLWPQIAYCMILYLTGLNNVSPDQIEAARLDGAQGWRMLWYVILPQLRPATFIAIVVTVIGALRSFDIVSIMTDGGPFGSSRVLSFYMYEQALSEYGYRMGYGAAIAVVLFMIMMIFITGFIWKMVRDERSGG